MKTYSGIWCAAGRPRWRYMMEAERLAEDADVSHQRAVLVVVVVVKPKSGQRRLREEREDRRSRMTMQCDLFRVWWFLP